MSAPLQVVLPRRADVVPAPRALAMFGEFVLLVDERFPALDASERAQVAAWIRRHLERRERRESDSLSV